MKSDLNAVSLGYTGQRRSAVSGTYLLGNGYRSFNPIIRRFSAWDSVSPFGRGGAHGYGYCSGDPVNQSDPSGHGIVTRLFRRITRVFRRNARRTATGAEDAAATAAADGEATGVGAADAAEAGVAGDDDFAIDEDLFDSGTVTESPLQIQGDPAGWFEVEDPESGQLVLGADKKVNSGALRQPLTRLRARETLRRRDILFLMGHGDESGLNWREGLRFGPPLTEDYVSGFEKFIKLVDVGKLKGRVRSRVLDGVSVDEFHEILNNTNQHVVMVSCWGIRDVELRNAKRLARFVAGSVSVA
ncbi:RHS repeat-associated core domain-containing protein [Paraburkholderia sp.]|jgi:RHS repeat-associated protein|uniref:RHS repeat-associated core domain-containing protein n=1 Tax=Paraburkholderia sp. TaxID=1926495 RepID=UPI002F411660